MKEHEHKTGHHLFWTREKMAGHMARMPGRPDVAGMRQLQLSKAHRADHEGAAEVAQ